MVIFSEECCQLEMEHERVRAGNILEEKNWEGIWTHRVEHDTVRQHEA